VARRGAQCDEIRAGRTKRFAENLRVGDATMTRSAFLPDNLPEVMGQDHDGAHRWATCVNSIVCPRPCEIVLRPGISADQSAHVPAAPRPSSA
jgi:hypothetical protein